MYHLSVLLNLISKKGWISFYFWQARQLNFQCNVNDNLPLIKCYKTPEKSFWNPLYYIKVSPAAATRRVFIGRSAPLGLAHTLGAEVVQAAPPDGWECMHGEWGMIHTTRHDTYTAMSLGASHFEHAVGGRDLTWARRRDWDKELSRDASERERRKRAKKRIESFLKLTRAMAYTTLPDFRELRVAPWENQKPAHETTRRHAPHLKFPEQHVGKLHHTPYAGGVDTTEILDNAV